MKLLTGDIIQKGRPLGASVRTILLDHIILNKVTKEEIFNGYFMKPVKKQNIRIKNNFWPDFIYVLDFFRSKNAHQN